MRVLLFLSILLPVGVACAGDDWSQWRGPDHTGVTDGPEIRRDLPTGGLMPVWQSEAMAGGGSGGWSSPAVAGDAVYVFTHRKDEVEGKEPPPKKFPWLSPDKRTGMTDEEYRQYEIDRREEDLRLGTMNYKFTENVYCLNRATGKTRWKWSEPSAYTRFPHSGTPAVADGRVYVLGAARTARCIDAASGEQVWQAELPIDFLDEYQSGSFLVQDGVAVVMATKLFGLDAVTGELLWTAEGVEGTHTSPVPWTHLGTAYAIVNSGGGQTACVRLKDGHVQWIVRTEANRSTPVVVGDALVTYGGSRKSGLRCFDVTPEGAEQRWVYQGLADKGSSPVVVDGFVYVQGEKRLACVGLDDGKDRWEATMDLARPQYTSLAAGGGVVFYAGDGLLWFESTPDGYRPCVAGKIDRSGRIASEDHFMKELREEVGDDADALRRKYDEEVGRRGPLACSTPAIADGRVFVRLPDRVACYDLRAAAASPAAAE